MFYTILDISTFPLFLRTLTMFSGRGRTYINGVEGHSPLPLSSHMMFVTSVDNTVRYQKMNLYFPPGP